MPSTSRSSASPSSAHRRVGATSASVTGSRRRGCRRDAGSAHQQRHAQRRVVDEDAVRVLAVLAERFAVIAGGDDQRVGRDAGRARRSAARPRDPRSRSHRRIDRAPAAPDRRIAVRRVRLEEVDPQEEVADWRDCWYCALESGSQAIASLTTSAAGRSLARLAVGAARQAIAVDVEAAVQAELMIERKRRDERRGRESPCACSSVASVGTSRDTRRPLSRAPWPGG